MADDALRKELLKGLGPLATEAARVKFAYALGWVGPETCCDLGTLRKIRNEFAHSATALSFEHPKIRQWCGGLKAPRHAGHRLRSRDQFLSAALFQGLRLSQLIERSTEPTKAEDVAIMRFPRLDGEPEELSSS